jgi:hypothetical protein
LLPAIRTDPASLISVCVNMATREMLGGEAFWSDYRRRFEQEPLRDVDYWLVYFATRSHQVELKLLPGK